MENSNRGSIPMLDKPKLSKSQGASIPAENPGELHWTAVKNILKYLQNTKDMFLVYEGAVDWKSTKQSILATSSIEAEYIAASDASKRLFGLGNSILVMGCSPNGSTYEDGIKTMTRDITIGNETGITKGARHYRTKVHYLNEVIEMGDIVREKVHTYDNVADHFTKALPFNKHFEDTKSRCRKWLNKSSLDLRCKQVLHVWISLFKYKSNAILNKVVIKAILGSDVKQHPQHL
ncbi:hypothetical protein Tco_0800119 [Tanacetum coccineum]|uniref:Uncharacterized protein n=1 Tax=Tanacetum coccineum TaxID=301880 RepID=A0ABQ4ZUX2_9ASTR